MMGYIIRHIHNRDLAAENIMTAYVRLRFVCLSLPASAVSLMERLTAAKIRMSKNSILRTANEVTSTHTLTSLPKNTYLLNLYYY
jgi:hypothetical protein